MPSKFVNPENKSGKAVARKGVSKLVKQYSKKHVEQKPSKVKSKARGHRNVEYPNGNKVRIKFAREPFRKFSKYFSHLDYNCMGSSINQKKLREAIEQDCKMIVVGYNNGSMYQFPAKLWKKWSEKNNTNRETLFQEQREKTYSVPLDKMERIK